MGSMKAIKETLKSKGGIGGGKLKIIPAEANFSVRFLTEPDEWHGFYEHYDQNKQEFFPCWGGDCCQDFGRPSFRFLANIFSQDDNKVMALKLPKGLGEDLIRSYEKYGTMMDRWYDISRVGTTLNDTKYNRDPDTPSKFRLPPKAQLIELDELLQSLLDGGDDDDDTDEPEEETPRRSRPASKTSGGYRPSKSSRRVLDDDDDDDYEDDDEDDEDDEPRRPAKKRVTSSTRSTGVKKRTVTRRK